MLSESQRRAEAVSVGVPTACPLRKPGPKLRALLAGPGGADTFTGVVDSDREHENRQHVRVNEVSEEDRTLNRVLAADCAERVLPLFDFVTPRKDLYLM